MAAGVAAVAVAVVAMAAAVRHNCTGTGKVVKPLAGRQPRVTGIRVVPARLRGFQPVKTCCADHQPSSRLFAAGSVWDASRLTPSSGCQSRGGGCGEGGGQGERERGRVSQDGGDAMDDEEAVNDESKSH